MKGTPLHIRGALIYNNCIKERKLLKKYQTIKSGEKIKYCYMKEPNPLRQNVLSIINVLPQEFGMSEYIDYETQFNKSFLEPLKLILDKIDWATEKKATLEDFFS